LAVSAASAEAAEQQRSSEAPPADREATVEEVTVTGSRVIQNGNNSPTPVTVVQAEQLQKVTPSNVPDALNRLPIFSSRIGQSNFNNGTLNSAGNYLALRGLGPERTLMVVSLDVV